MKVLESGSDTYSYMKVKHGGFYDPGADSVGFEVKRRAVRERLRCEQALPAFSYGPANAYLRKASSQRHPCRDSNPSFEHSSSSNNLLSERVAPPRLVRSSSMKPQLLPSLSLRGVILTTRLGR